MPWFPVVGAFIGAVVGLVAAGMMELVPASVAAAVAVILGVLVTGAFHEDGLADTADAMGGWTPERRREILKDSRHGSYGVAAMCATIVLRIVCVATLGPAAAFAGLVAAHTLGRGAAVGVMGTARAGRRRTDSGPTTPGRCHVRRPSSASSLRWRSPPLRRAGGSLPLAAAAGIGAALVARTATRAFGGISGDILGAVEQVGECLVLIVVTGLALRHQLWWT